MEFVRSFLNNSRTNNASENDDIEQIDLTSESSDSESRRNSVVENLRITVQNNNTRNRSMSVKPPKYFVVKNEIDNSNEWAAWLDAYKQYFIAAKINTEIDEIQCANFRTVLGYDGNRILRNMNLDETELGDLQTIKHKLTQYFSPSRNKTYERYQFHRINQKPNEHFMDFYQRLRIQVTKCDYRAFSDEFLVDQIVLGVSSDQTRQKLWLEEEPTLSNVLKICRAEELAEKQLAELSEKPNISAINRNDKQFKCKRCGSIHGYKQCKAFGKKCLLCKGTGHFKEFCYKNKKEKKDGKNGGQSGAKYEQKAVHTTTNHESESESDFDNDFRYHCDVLTTAMSNKRWYETVIVGEKELKLKLDTGADCNCISLADAKRLNAKIAPSLTGNIVAYNNQEVNVVGETSLWCQLKSKQSHKVLFKVISGDVDPILGRSDCAALNLVVRVSSVDLGCCKDFEYEIDLIDKPQFKIFPARRIAHALRAEAKDQLEKMVKMKVIKPISEPTPAVSPMVVVKQGAKIRICLDPTDLNKNIKRRHYPLKTVEEIAAKVNGSKFFSKLDCQKGFWQIKVSERTSKYLAFATPWGRYTYLRLPFGICSAPEIFSEIMNKTLEGIEKVEVAMDDIFIHAADLKTLKETTQKVINRLKEAGFTLNDEKCEFDKTMIKFLGHIFTQNGYKADNEKIKAIGLLKAPTCVKELQRTLGMINYVGKFVKSLSELTEPLRSLLHSDTAWTWDEMHQKAFEKIKETLTTTPVLAYYDVNKDVTLSVDASSKSMGACLMQDGKPVAYAAKSLNNSQQNQPQIVREALAIRFGCNKFHEYVYGKKILIETDHKPLETIFKNPVHQAPLRLHRILWDVLPYNPIVKYIKGTKIPIADALSRDCNCTEVDAEEKYEINAIIEMSMTEDMYKRLIEQTNKDEELQQLKTIVMNGWPESDSQLPKQIRKYATFKSEIVFDDTLLFKGNKIIVPKAAIPNFLTQIHTGHPGIERSLARARRSLYWCGISNDIKDFVEKCSVCQQTQPANAAEPLIMKQVPSFPFQIVSTDIFTFKQRDYLLLADHYSGWMDFKKLSTLTANETIQIIKKWFSDYGVPEILESDGGTQFTSNEFAEFAADWAFKHRISSPHYPKSNGFAERNVQTAKNLLRKCAIDGTDIHKAMLMLRNTDRNDKLKSPAQRLFSRNTRTPLPILKDDLKPKIVEDVQTELTKLRAKQKMYADQHTKAKQPVKVGDKVLVRVDHRQWKPAEVIEQTEYPRSVIIKTEDNRKFRRNTFHLRKTASNSQSSTETASKQQTSVSNEQTTHSASNDQNSNTQSIQTNQTVTRYGRVVKPVNRLNYKKL